MTTEPSTDPPAVVERDHRRMATGLAPGGAVEVALLDTSGVIVAVNDAWTSFCLDNGGDPSRSGVGVSYLEVCEATAGDEASADVAAAIRAAASGELPAPLRVPISCDAPGVPRWYDVLISSRLADDGHVLGVTVTLSRTQEQRTSEGRPQHAAALTRLHDEVVEELTVVSMGLQTLMRHLARQERHLIVDGYVEALDSTIGRLWNAIERLRDPEPRREGLKQRVLRVLDEETAALGISAQIDFAGDLDSDLSDVLADDIVAVLRGGLSNAARNARAESVNVVVIREDDAVTVRIADDGWGSINEAKDGGLFELRRRATAHRGTLEVLPMPTGGTLVTWTARTR
ncbi:MAG TPA: PAS domain-containing protein [Propionibacteriaceae bacterium]